MSDFIHKNLMMITVYAATLMLLIISFIISPNFISWKHLMLILTLASFLIVVSFGQGLVILGRGLDLSVGSMITLSGVLVGAWINQANEGIFWAIPLILIIVSLVGCFNGIGVTYFGIPPFVMTLATGIIVYSGTLGFTGGSPSKGNAPSLLNKLMLESTFNVPNIVYFLIVFVVIATLLQHYSVYGRKLYAYGSNPEASRIVGLKDKPTIIASYAISGFCSALTGIMLVGYSDAATLRMGDPYVMMSIAAVVIGGSSILGGKGKYLGTVGGVLLLTVLSTLITAIGLSKGWRTIIQGSAIIIALIVFAVSEYSARVKK